MFFKNHRFGETETSSLLKAVFHLTMTGSIMAKLMALETGEPEFERQLTFPTKVTLSILLPLFEPQ